MKLLKYFIFSCVILAVLITMLNYSVNSGSKKYIYSEIMTVPQCYTALVLGAAVSNTGYLSEFLQDRLDVAIELYNEKKINRFLLSGDHGRPSYDEVNSMKDYLLDKGIDSADIFLDHAGFDTYNSIFRAKHIFLVKDMIIVTQNFHLSRAIYIAHRMGLTAYGVSADRHQYSSVNRLKKREILANIKAFTELLIHRRPKYLGVKIPIMGDSQLSWD